MPTRSLLLINRLEGITDHLILYILVRNDPLQQIGQNGVRKKRMTFSEWHLEVDSRVR